MKWIKIFILILCIIIELFIFKTEYIWFAALLSFFIVAILGFIIWYSPNMSLTDLEMSFIKTFQTKILSIAGFMAAFYILLHIAWLGDMLIAFTLKPLSFSYEGFWDFGVCQWEGFKENQNGSAAIFFSLFMFSLPFMIFPFLKKSKEKEPIPKEERTVLVTAVSTLSKPRQNKDQDNTLVNRNWHNWETVHKILKSYYNIKTVILIFSSDSMVKYQNNISLGDFEEDWNTHIDNKLSAYIVFKKLIRKQFPNVIRIEKTDKLIDFNDFNSFHNDLKVEIDAMLKGVDDKKILFNISGGTSLLSSSLTLLALKGKRGIIYTTQNEGEGNPIKEVQADIRTIDNLLEELQEAIEE